MEEILLIIIAVLGVIVAYFAWRVADQMPDIAFRLSEIQRDMATVARKASEPAPAPVVQAAPAPVAEPVPEAPDAPAAETEPAAAPAPSQPMPARARGRGRAVMLPNGQKRIDYIRDRFYKENVSRSDIRKEINQIMADAGIDDKIQYQIVFAATKDPADPRDNPTPRRRRGAAAAEAGAEAGDGDGGDAAAEDAAADAAPAADADTGDAPESGDTRENV